MAWSGYLPDLFVVVVFVVGGTLVAERGVEPGAVVPADVLHDRPPGPGPRRPGPGIDELAFERGEERLRECVVPALARPAGRQGHLALVGEGGVGGRGVLAA